MPLNLGTVALRLIADPSTPERLRKYHGTLIPLTAELAAALPSGIDVIMILGVTVPGFKRPGEVGLEWVMTPLVDPSVAMLEALPSPGGWADPAAEQTWTDAHSYLLGQGIRRDKLLQWFPLLYDAAVANYKAQQAAP